MLLLFPIYFQLHQPARLKTSIQLVQPKRSDSTEEIHFRLIHQLALKGERNRTIGLAVGISLGCLVLIALSAGSVIVVRKYLLKFVAQYY